MKRESFLYFDVPHLTLSTRNSNIVKVISCNLSLRASSSTLSTFTLPTHPYLEPNYYHYCTNCTLDNLHAQFFVLNFRSLSRFSSRLFILITFSLSPSLCFIFPLTSFFSLLFTITLTTSACTTQLHQKFSSLTQSN